MSLYFWSAWYCAVQGINPDACRELRELQERCDNDENVVILTSELAGIIS
jgi:hypothetical protein